jgi:hypothetical protein
MVAEDASRRSVVSSQIPGVPASIKWIDGQSYTYFNEQSRYYFDAFRYCGENRRSARCFQEQKDLDRSFADQDCSSKPLKDR